MTFLGVSREGLFPRVILSTAILHIIPRLYEQCSKETLLRLGYVIFKNIIAAAVSEPGANERGSSLIGKKLHYGGIQSFFSHRCSALPIKLTSQLGAGR